MLRSHSVAGVLVNGLSALMFHGSQKGDVNAQVSTNTYGLEKCAELFRNGVETR